MRLEPFVSDGKTFYAYRYEIGDKVDYVTFRGGRIACRVIGEKGHELIVEITATKPPAGYFRKEIMHVSDCFLRPRKRG